jgi:hypothetical protein
MIVSSTTYNSRNVRWWRLKTVLAVGLEAQMLEPHIRVARHAGRCPATSSIGAGARFLTSNGRAAVWMRRRFREGRKARRKRAPMINNVRRRSQGRPPRRTSDNNGNARQQYERYLARARAAHLSGDAVEMENCYQHAEHYFRVLRGDGHERRNHL